MQTYDKGSAIIIEVEFKKQTPFGSAAYFDPSTAKVTVTDPTGTNKVTDASLTQSTTGKYYYICQTETTWAAGIYSVKVTSTDGSASDVTVDYTGFKLR